MSRFVDADDYGNILRLMVANLKSNMKEFALYENYASAERMKVRLGATETCLFELERMPTADVVPTKALRLFIEWADECGFGYDNIPDEYEKYKDDIKDMGWIEGFMYIVLKEAEKNA